MRDSKLKQSLRPGQQAGFSIIEVMIAMVVMSVGMIGLVGMLNVAAKRDGDGRRKDRGTAIAYDLLHHLERLPITAPELADVYTSNGTDLMDDTGGFAGIESTALPSTTFDHTDAILGDPAVSGNSASGIDTNFLGYVPAANGGTLGDGDRPTLDFNNDGKDDFKRQWIIVDEPDPINSALVKGKKISVVVTWRDPAMGIRQRVTVVGYRANRSLTRPVL